MFNLILDWLQISDLHVSDDVLALICSMGGFMILGFLLDFFKMLYYSIVRR